MRRAATALAMILGWASAAWAAEPGTLTTLHAVHSLSKAEAAKGLPVAFEATVTYYNRTDTDLFVQDANEAIYVAANPNQSLSPGDRVLVRGITRDSFRTDIVSSAVTRIGTAPLPMPVPASFQQLVRAQLDCMRVTVRAKVRSVDRVNFGDLPGVDFKLMMDGGYIDAEAIDSDANKFRQMLDAEVEVTGVAAGNYDTKDQFIGVLLEVGSLADIKIVNLAQINPDSLPVTPMDQVLSSYDVNDRTGRVRVQGTITYYQPGSAVVLQNGDRSLWVMTQFAGPLRIGDWADATGFPDVNGVSLTLNRSEIQDSQTPSPVAPRKVNGAELASGLHAFDLVAIDGRVVTSARAATQDEYVLEADGKLFSAIYRHPDAVHSADLPGMKEVTVGSTIHVTGICLLQYSSDPYHGPVAVDVLLRSFDDVAIVGRPSLLSVGNLAVAAGLLFVLMLAAGVRGWILERRIRRQTAELAYIERRRSRILEDINGSRPLAEIIEQITELVSFKLKGALCWCRIAEGAQLGNCPAKLDAFRIIQEEIPARSGPPLGTVYAALDPLTTPQPIESEALTMAAALSALATETRRIYSDLRRRSEFDLLTDTHNRFSLDKHLDGLIEEARQKAGIFGLIYIDLNEFKQINDLYGHQVGDHYLQEVALRMKRQLRSHDLLARLGGDEFAALVPVVRSRTEVEEIAQRLERSFDDPFVIDRYTIQGSASVGIALYPEDGSSKDSLLSHADAAMYVAKNSSREFE
jgi:diguanylate cyclase (GGDEF)-like protein